ncbi:hypothetical protein FJZ53_05265 [Candidatus Woesearchaeota archaeon]|nr:hypothetical protein [Candidatus Woesearchaeota archaeon]
MAKKSYFLEEDIQFHFKNTIDWKKIAPLYEELDDKFKLEDAVGMYNATLKELGTISANELEETAKESDEVGAKLEDGEVVYTEGFKQGLKAFKESDALALNVKREYSGPGMPGIVNVINMEMMCKADPAFMTVYAFYAGVAKTLEASASEEMKQKYIPMLVSGECNGSMSLTEPDAGSDLGQIRTLAENKGDHWEVTGNKIFISNGNGELSLVLARSDPKTEGKTGGLSMYLVPRFIEKNGKKATNFKLERLEHKLGIKGSPTLELSFDKSIGYLVGKEGDGLKQMFYLMNEARLGVSVQALGIAQKALEEAKEYANQRVQFGKAIGKHELLADKILDMETDVKAIRSLIYKAAEYEDIKTGLEDKLKNFTGNKEEKAKLQRQFKKYKFLAREMIPLIKYFAAEKSIQIARDNVQIHGGNGYTTEYNAELHLRNAVITAIYEGTSQIQSLMAMGDTLKSSKVLPYVESFKSVGRLCKALVKGKMGSNVIFAQDYFNRAVDYMKRPFAIAKLKKDRKAEAKALSYAMLYSERLTKLKAYKTVIEILVDEAKKFPERKPLAERFIRNYMPEMRKESEFICSGDKTTLDYIKNMK